MKYWLTMVAVCLVCAGTAVAQEADAGEKEPAGGPAFGVKGWVGWGLPSYENLPEGAQSETATSWAVGAFFTWSTKGVISLGIQPELMYVSESGQNTFTALLSGQPIMSETKINSLRLPVLFKLQFLDPLIVQPSIYVGPAFSYIMSATNTINGTEYDLDESSFQVGFAAGIDVTVLSFLVVDLRYNTKFSSVEAVVQGIEGHGDVPVNLTMSSFKVGLGLRF